MRLRAAAVFACILAAGCGSGAEQAPADTELSIADSLAQEVLDANGGTAAWESIRFISFTYATEVDGARSDVARHVWDRQSGRDRVEWARGDSTIVAVFNTDEGDGDVFVDGVPADTSMYDTLLQEGRRRFSNDSYWLLGPVQLFHPGVERHYQADSVDAEVEVLRLTYKDQPSRPDTCWVYVDRDSGTVRRWVLALAESGQTVRSAWEWREYRDFEAPEGMVRFGTRKESVDGRHAVITDEIELPAVIPDSVFNAARPAFR